MNTNRNIIALISLLVCNLLLASSLLMCSVVIDNTTIMEENVNKVSTQLDDLYSEREYLFLRLSSEIYKYDIEDATRVLVLADKLKLGSDRDKSLMGIYREFSSAHSELASSESFQNQMKEMEYLENEIQLIIGKYNEQVNEYEKYCSKLLVKYCYGLLGLTRVTYSSLGFDSSISSKLE